MTIRVKSAPVNDFTSNVCGETAGSLHYISGITPERANQVLNIDKGGGNPPLTYFMEGCGAYIIATKLYINMKWQRLPAITNTWKISCVPKLGCFALNAGILIAYITPPTV